MGVKNTQTWLYSYFSLSLTSSLLLILSFFQCKETVKPINKKDVQSLSSINIEQSENTDSKILFPYNLNQPSKIIKLPKRLKEISGLCSISPNEVAAVADEKGIVYIINLKTEEISSEIDFGKAGDYEGIAKVDKALFVVRSDGKLFEINTWQKSQKKLKTINFKTNLNAENDIEGLCYDKKNKQLLLAGKGQAKHSKKDQKTLYSYSLNQKENNHKLTEWCSINTKELKKLNSSINGELKTEKSFNPSKFAPSGWAIHPKSNKHFLISFHGYSLLMFDECGKWLGIRELPKKLLPQPEAICFDPSGNLILATEGVNGSANIYIYETD